MCPIHLTKDMNWYPSEYPYVFRSTTKGSNVAEDKRWQL